MNFKAFLNTIGSTARTLPIVILYVTESCNLKCITCSYREALPGELSLDEIKGLASELNRLGLRHIVYSGGEPLLRRDLFQVLAQADTSPLKRIILQTNGLLIKKLHQEINESPITHVCVSMDGLKETNDQIRGIRGYFDLGLEGIRLLRDKKMAISVTMNRISARELERLAEVAKNAGAEVEVNILSRNLFFFKDADIDSMWPGQPEVAKIAEFLRSTLRRPGYEVDYVTDYYKNELITEPPCVLGYLQVFVLSNGDVLTGCYSLKPVGNVLRDSLENILSSKAYAEQAAAMVRRECPGCTCGVESSLAMKHAVSSGLIQLGALLGRPQTGLAAAGATTPSAS